MENRLAALRQAPDDPVQRQVNRRAVERMEPSPDWTGHSSVPRRTCRIALAFVLTALATLVPSTSVRGEEDRSHRSCTITGTRDADQLIEGTDGADVICGLGGQDKIKGRGGDDLIYGGRGRDLIYGHRGDDEIWGGAGRDEIRAGIHADRIHGGFGHDAISLEAGSDAAWGGRGSDGMSATGGPDVLRGGRGRDAFCTWDAKGDDLVLGGRGWDRYHADPHDTLRSVERHFRIPACG